MESKNRARAGMRGEKRKEGNDPEGRSKKRKELVNDNSSVSMFAKQQTVSDLNKARVAYNAHLQKGKEMGLEEAAETEPVSHKKLHGGFRNSEIAYSNTRGRGLDQACYSTPFSRTIVRLTFVLAS